MSDKNGFGEKVRTNSDVTIKFSDRFTQSAQFQEMFKEGMALVEETASYLDGDGRVESRSLSRSASLVYATESMRLTTRLMQLASWLLLHRAVQEGEITLAEASNEKRKVQLQSPGTIQETPEYAEMPSNMHGLIDRSMKLYTRVMSIDAMIYSDDADEIEQPINPIMDQLDALKSAFSVENRV